MTDEPAPNAARNAAPSNREISADMRRHISAPAQPAESPEARVSVPVVPNDAMYEAAAQAWKGTLNTYWAREMWDAMLAASPPEKTPETAFAATTARPTERGAVEAWTPAGFVLTERSLDDDCGCPEEFWDTPFGVLHMHLNAGKPSNACLDNGDEGEWSTDVIAATVDDARAALLGWAHVAALTPPVTVAATDQAGEVEKLREERRRGW